MSPKKEHHAELARQLGLALAMGQFHLVYQPQFDLRTQEICGMEALLRWEHPRLGSIPPSTFIPVAEKHGLMVRIGLWVVQKVCEQALSWMNRGHHFGRIGFNVSALQLKDGEAFEAFARALYSACVPLGLLEMEVTESICARASSGLRRELERLADGGLHLAVDDFGTGNCSIVALHGLNAETLKIDRHLIREMLNHASDASIVKAIIALGRSLNMRVLAEGVEEEAQRAYLIEQGCDVAQGFLFCRPVLAEEIEQRYFLKAVERNTPRNHRISW